MVQQRFSGLKGVRSRHRTDPLHHVVVCLAHESNLGILLLQSLM